MILAEGVTARDDNRDAAKRDPEIASLRTAACAASAILGAERPQFANLPDNRLDTIPLLDVIKFIERMVASIAPKTVYTHHGNDLNVDHQVAHQAVLTACRPVPGMPVKAIYAFETLSSTEWASPNSGHAFWPTRYVAITEQLDVKLQALNCYQSEIRPFPYARSMEAVTDLARLRGATVGVDAAEAFFVIREVFP